jgi:hypothetical protein
MEYNRGFIPADKTKEDATVLFANPRTAACASLNSIGNGTFVKVFFI